LPDAARCASARCAGPRRAASTSELTVVATARCCDHASGGPAANVPIAVGDQVVATTDADGLATVAVDGPTTVTAVFPTDSVMSTALVTVFAAAPGDTLALGERYRDLSTVTATATITWDAQTASQIGYLCGRARRRSLAAPCRSTAGG